MVWFSTVRELFYVEVDVFAVCVYISRRIRPEGEGGTAVILRELCDKHFLALLDMLITKIDVRISGFAVKVVFS